MAPSDEAHAHLLPFPGPVEAAGPKPVLEYHSYFVVDGVPIHIIGQRWKAEHAGHAPAPTHPDPANPDVLLTTFAQDIRGRVIPVVSFSAFQAYSLAVRQAPTGQAAAGYLGQ